jgi:hypothetical protein
VCIVQTGPQVAICTADAEWQALGHDMSEHVLCTAVTHRGTVAVIACLWWMQVRCTDCYPLWVVLATFCNHEGPSGIGTIKWAEMKVDVASSMHGEVQRTKVVVLLMRCLYVKRCPYRRGLTAEYHW